MIAETVPREGLFRAQTPQAFRFERCSPRTTPDVAGAPTMPRCWRLGQAVAIVPGSENNIKLTFPDDLARLERMPLAAAALVPRVGTGFDVHVLAGRPMVLCGVTVPHDKGLAGHSDADVGIHALCDAIYGALAEGDIGRHFPPGEASWKNADSAHFLAHAAGRIAARGGRLVNADITLICERPKITPHAQAMRERLAGILGVEVGCVSVKATTTERLGFTGRGEGIAAQAAASCCCRGEEVQRCNAAPRQPALQERAAVGWDLPQRCAADGRTIPGRRSVRDALTWQPGHWDWSAPLRLGTRPKCEWVPRANGPWRGSARGRRPLVGVRGSEAPALPTRGPTHLRTPGRVLVPAPMRQGVD